MAERKNFQGETKNHLGRKRKRPRWILRGRLYEKEFITLPRYPIYNILYTLKEDEIRAYRLRKNGAHD